jgi:branched-chain amino acid transport system substrate-binding protein
VKKLLFPLHLLALLLAATSCLPGLSTRPTFKIGLVAPFEGLYRHLGYDALHAAKLAIGERNQSGGVEGYMVELVALNDNQDPEEATHRAREMAVDADIVGVVGHFCDETTLAALQAYEEAGLALVVPASTASAVTSGGYAQTYRLVADNAVIGEVAARYAVLEKAAEKVAVVGGPQDLTNSFVRIAERAGAEVVPHQIQDHGVLASQLAAEGPDMVFLACEGAEAAEVLLTLREAGQGMPVLGANGLNTPHFAAIAGEAAEGVTYVSVTSPLLNRGFSEAYIELSGAAPGPYSALSYDAVGLLLDAAGECIAVEGKPSRACVAESLAEIGDYDGVTGRISFDGTGQAIGREVYLYEMVEGQYPGEVRDCPVCLTREGAS